MKSALAAEQEFFIKSPSYSHIAKKQGTVYLSHRLNAILEDHIRSCMPDISNRVKTMLRDATVSFQNHSRGNVVLGAAIGNETCFVFPFVL
mmetsp:Transcript_16665/g.45364  ORF Transcript_16665/g.45364 Transcript_16665/m.45364 type:complete len:91 (+) Transcript_16665:400-672(+)